jgi:tripartite-type tricarboxylate transporter receptor subunit TctC
LGEALNVIKDDWKGNWNIGGAGRRCNRPEFLGPLGHGRQASDRLFVGILAADGPKQKEKSMAIGERSWASAAVAVALFGAHVAVQAQAQDFPVRPVHVIVPFAPGGGVDIVARLIAPKLSAAWGQPVVIENKPGAVGAVASEYVMHQPADGYTVLIGVAGSHAIAQYLNPNLGYDPVRDFAGVTVLSYSPLICLVAPSSPFHTMKELVEFAKTTTVPFGSPGVGSQMHLIGEMFNLNYGTKFQHVAYRGVAPAMQDLLGGHIPMVMGEMGSAKPLVTSGQLRALAVTGTKRNASVPDVSTFTQAGFPNFEVNSWFALFAPAATPKPIVDKIAADVSKIVRSPEISARLADDGWEPGGGTPQEFTALWLRTAKELGAVIQQRHITIE